LISLCLAAFHGMLAVLELDLRDLTRLRRWVRRGRVRVLRILVIVEPEPSALGGFVVHSSSRIVREPIILVLPTER